MKKRLEDKRSQFQDPYLLVIDVLRLPNNNSQSLSFKVINSLPYSKVFALVVNYNQKVP